MTPPVTHIRSRDNEMVQRLRRLSARPGAYRDAGVVWLEGDHLVRALFERGLAAVQAVITDAAWEGRPDLRALAMLAQRVAVVPASLMASFSTLESSAPLGVLMPWPLQGQGLDATGLMPVQGDGGPMLVLDRLQDPGNVGSMLRSAAALGVRTVLALQGTVALWSPKVLRAGMGAHFALDLQEALEPGALQPLAARLVVTTLADAQPLHEARLPPNPVWVLGHEGGGVQPALAEVAACRVRIPQPGGQESLNVAAAAAICLYEGLRRSLGAEPQ